MKVLCDVCKGEEAAVYCCADEAALCGACDGRVHQANKLAGKHRRFSLLHPASPKQFPLCDICQEKRAFLFCQEDRAILCTDCDAAIHTANDLTKKHSRFLLTGIKLSPSATPAGASSSDCVGSAAVSSTTSEDGGDPPGHVNNAKHRGYHSVDAAPKQRKKAAAAVPPVALETTNKNNRDTVATATGLGNGKATAGSRGVFSGPVSADAVGGNSISEYLMKELPGWHVEDLLLDSSPAVHPAVFNFAKMTGDDLLPFLEADLNAAGGGGAFPGDDGGGSNLSQWWVPQVPQVSPALPPLPPSYGYDQTMGTGMAGELMTKLAARQLQQQQHHHLYQQQCWNADDCFTVPEVSTVQAYHDNSKSSKPASWGISL